MNMDMNMDHDHGPDAAQARPARERPLLGLLPVFILVMIIVLRISWTLYKSFGQKTRNPQQRRMYAGTRARPSLGQPEPSVYVSPSNLPPPPKYECIAPPSYEEVVGVHYPQYQPQPITQPISEALANAVAHSTCQAQGSTNNSSQSVVAPVTRNNNGNAVTETIVTVPDTRPLAVAASS